MSRPHLIGKKLLVACYSPLILLPILIVLQGDHAKAFSVSHLLAFGALRCPFLNHRLRVPILHLAFVGAQRSDFEVNRRFDVDEQVTRPPLGNIHLAWLVSFHPLFGQFFEKLRLSGRWKSRVQGSSRRGAVIGVVDIIIARPDNGRVAAHHHFRPEAADLTHDFLRSSNVGCNMPSGSLKKITSLTPTISAAASCSASRIWAALSLVIIFSAIPTSPLVHST